jgi:hypothetical protein
MWCQKGVADRPEQIEEVAAALSRKQRAQLRPEHLIQVEGHLRAKRCRETALRTEVPSPGRWGVVQ